MSKEDTTQIDAGEVFRFLASEYFEANGAWDLFCALFARSESRVVALEQVDAAFFGWVYSSIARTVILAVARVTDDGKAGSKLNASVVGLAQMVRCQKNDESLLVEQERALVEAAAALRAKRHKELAHNDMQFALHGVGNGVTKAGIDECLARWRVFMEAAENAVGIHFMWDSIAAPPCAGLLRRLGISV